MGEKSVFEAYLLAVTPLSFLGGVHFYLNRPHVGVLYACTAGVLGIGVIVDLFRLPTLVREANAKRQHKKDPTVDLPKEKSIVDAYLMWFPLGLLGLHHVYLKNPNWALLYALTGGLFVVGWIVDAVWMVSMVNSLNTRLTDPMEKQRKMERKAEKERKKKAKQKGALEMDPADIINNKDTRSIVGAETMRSTPRLDGVDDRQVITGDKITKKEKETRATFALGLSPLGILGAHHWYLRRSTWGILYMLTGGLAGIGWIMDWFRLVLLLRRCNSVAKGEKDKKEKTVDDAYVLWFPWGILGVHQFYLGRHTWGFIYLFTAGIFGVGWLSDAVRIPQLVKESNQRRVESKQDHANMDIDANITPPRDDYDTSLTLNLGDDNNGGDTRRSRTSQLERVSERPVEQPVTTTAVAAGGGGGQ